jgi:mRNA interferase RelE/StbE
MSQNIYGLRVPREIAELIRKMHPHIKKKVKESMRMILEEPRSGKPLKEELSGLWSFRIGRIRIIYKIGEEIIEVVTIGPREIIYEETARLMRGKGR